MKKITMMDFRKSPGSFIHEVNEHGKSFILTSSGKPVAKLVPLDEKEKRPKDRRKVVE